jgi:hypothetical protein
VTTEIAYQYRIRAENVYGFSPYSAVVNVTIPAAKLLPPSNLQAVAVSQTQINLTWSNANTNAIRFHIERKIGTGTYTEISVVPATASSYQDTTVQANAAYTYRARSEGPSGLSAYSNEGSATTPSLPLPVAPALQGAAASASQVHLSWGSAATGVVRFRIERRTATGVYAEIAQPSAISTAYDDSSVAGSTGYFYRMRAETTAGLSPYSNEVGVTTGLNQGPSDMKNLATNPAASYGLAEGRFRIDYGFDFSDCVDATLAFCSSNCTIPNGAQRLAQYIVTANPPGDIILVGFSLGGLIVRDLIVNFLYCHRLGHVR